MGGPGRDTAGAPFEEGTEPPDDVWTTGGAGSVNVVSETAIVINSAGTSPTFAQRSFTTEPGREYVVTATGANNPVYFEVGTAAGLDDLYASTILLVNVIGSVADWTDISGPGTVTADAGNQTLTINAAGGTPTLVRRSYPVVAGKNYRLSWTTSGTTCASALGNASGGEQYKGLGTQHDPLGDNDFTLQVTTGTLWVQFQRTAAGTCVISNLALEQLD